MRRLGHTLVGLLLGLGSQVAVLWATVLLAKSRAFEPLRNQGPGSVGDILLMLALLLALETLLAAVLALLFRRSRRVLVVILSVLALATLVAVVAFIGFALV